MPRNSKTNSMRDRTLHRIIIWFPAVILFLGLAFAWWLSGFIL